MAARWVGPGRLGGKGRGGTKHKSVVTEQPQGCEVQHREYSRYYCNYYVQCQRGGHFLNDDVTVNHCAVQLKLM